MVSKPTHVAAQAERKIKAEAKAKVLVVDDHPVVRQGMAQLISHEPDLTVCGEAGSVPEALQAIAACHPDVAVVDLSLKGASGLELLKDIKVRYPRLPVLVLSMADENVFAERALRAGARGYMMKEEAAEKVLEAIRCVMAGRIYLSDAMASRLLHQFVDGKSEAGASPVDGLSDRELEVFQLIGRGLGTGEIARQLHLSPKTIETYRAHIKNKMNLESATELLQHAIQYVQSMRSGT
ncbi:MAG: response regulator transcription factor [Planctomycetota bacterium]|nr:response regulator transcription factor [Planctomycetota bacterium]